MSDLHVGVIGTGAIGETHVERLTNCITGAKVVAVSDINSEKARGIAEKYNAEFFEQGEDLIRSPSVQAIVVASWDPTHEKYVLEAIRAGKYVFCEKPLAETAESCLRIMDAEVLGGKQLVQVGFMRRFDAGYRSMKAALDSGEFGEPLMVHCIHRNATSNSQYETKVNVTGTAIHEIDIVRWLLEEEIVSANIIQPKVSRHVRNNQLDPQIIMLRTESGVTIDIETFMHCQYGYDVQCEIVGEDGTVRLPSPAQISLKRNGEFHVPILKDWSLRFVDAYNVEFQSWVNNTKKGVVAGPTAWDGYAAIVVSDACLRSRETGVPEKVVLRNKPDFYK